jgi:hypothetical protein
LVALVGGLAALGAHKPLYDPGELVEPHPGTNVRAQQDQRTGDELARLLQALYLILASQHYHA